MHIVVVYDIPDDKRRERLRKTLLAFGRPVQYSVFECELTARQIQKMKREISKIMAAAEDNVRYYLLCRACARSVETFGGAPLTKIEKAYIV